MIGILPENRLKEWDEFAWNHQSGSIYHISSWFKVIQKTYNIRPVIFAEFKDDIKFGIPFILHQGRFGNKRLISITSAQSCNPLVNNTNELNELILFIKYYLKKNNINFFELRVTDSFPIQILNANRLVKEFFSYTIDLENNYDTVAKGFHKSCIIRPLKKAMTQDIKIVSSYDLKSLRAFYHNYEIMRRDHGLLPQPFKFFQNLIIYLAPHNFIDCKHALYNNSIISSVINLKYKDKYVYEYGATNKNFIHLHPNHLLINLINDSIKSAIDQSYKQFDFGRTDSSNKGLENFKKRWGGKKEYFSYYYFYNHLTVSEDEQSFLKSSIPRIIKHLPYVIYHSFGQLLYKTVFR